MLSAIRALTATDVWRVSCSRHILQSLEIPSVVCVFHQHSRVKG